MKRLLGFLLATSALAASPMIWKDGNYGKLLTQRGFQLNDGKEYRTISVNPSSGAGVAAAIGSVAVRNNAGTGEIWYKAGAADTAWTQVPSASGLTGWLLGGNSGTSPGTDFLGTSDTQDFVIKTDGVERLRISAAGGYDTTLGAGIVHSNGSGILSSSAVALASEVSGTLPIANGGTGQTSAANAINALLPTQSGHVGEFLKTNGSVASWATAVTGVTATPPLNSSGGSTPDISIDVASGSQPGALSAADWTTFNNKFSLPALTTGSVVFSNGSTLAQDNVNFFWDNTDKTLRLGGISGFSGSQTLRALKESTDPISDTSAGVLAQGKYTLTDDNISGLYGSYNIASVKVAAGKTLSGGLIGTASILNRQEVGDDGNVQFMSGSFSQLLFGNTAHTADVYAGFLTGFHSIDNLGTITDFYDFLAESSSIPGGVITNRYGIVVKPDSGYIKKNWLSGNLLLGGTSYSAPSQILHVEGDIYATKSVVDDDTVGAEIHSTMHATVDGSHTALGIQGIATGIVDSGAHVDKAVSAILGTAQRGDGTDDGLLDALDGITNIVLHNSGAAGVTTDVSLSDNVLISQGGTITNLYDFRSQRVPAGGTVTNHFGLYVKADTTTPVQSWLGDKTRIGGTSFSAPTADLHLPGVTAAAGTASLKIDSGTLLTAAENGAVESDGMNLWWTDDTGTRKQLDGGGGGTDTVVNGGDTAYTILSGDSHVRSGTTLTANRVWTLPACSSNIGEKHVIKKADNTAFTITVDGNSSDTVDGLANYVLTTYLDSVSVICAVSGNWDVQ